MPFDVVDRMLPIAWWQWVIEALRYLTAASALEQFIKTALLVLYPHNYSKALAIEDKAAVPRRPDAAVLKSPPAR